MRLSLVSTACSLLVLSALSVPVSAIGTGEAKGSLVTDGVAKPLSYAWAKMAPDEYSDVEGAENLVVLLASRPLRPRELGENSALVEPARAGELEALILTISGERVSSVQVYNLQWAPLGTGSSSIELEKISEADGVVEYKVRLDVPEDFFDHTWAFDVHFRTGVGREGVYASNPRADAALAARTTGLALGGAKGTFTVDGATHPLNHVVAYSEQNPFDETKRETHVLVSNVPITTAQATDQSALVALASSGEFHAVRVKIDQQEEPIAMLALSGELGAMVSGNRIAVFEGIRFDGKTVEGTLRTREEKEFMGHTFAYDVAFHAAVQPSGKPEDFSLDASNATALPKDGGEVGKAWLQEFRAVESARSLRELKDLGLDIPEEAFDDPEADLMLELMKAMRPEKIRVVEGFTDGSRAMLKVEGVERESGDRTTGTIRLLKEGDRWESVSESWSTTLD